MRRQVVSLELQVETERARYSALVEVLHQMHREGFSPRVMPDPIELPSIPAEIETTIIEIAGVENSPLRKQLVAYALVELGRGVTASAIAAAIRTGQ